LEEVGASFSCAFHFFLEEAGASFSCAFHLFLEEAGASFSCAFHLFLKEAVPKVLCRWMIFLSGVIVFYSFVLAGLAKDHILVHRVVSCPDLHPFLLGLPLLHLL
jgi:hypothetical protein